MDNTVWFLTSNAGKLAEAAQFFSKLGVAVHALEVPEGSVVEPQASTLKEVAEAKIRQALNHLPHDNAMVLVEDAGLFVDALDGFPGVYSSYVHETIGNAGLLRLLSHLLSEDPARSKRLRSASFQAVAALWDGKEIHVGQGVCKGSIAYGIEGDGGFGYDPIFIPSDLDEEGMPLDPETLGVVSTHGQTFRSVEADMKHQFSHRRRALEDIAQQIQHLLNR